jgi:hypothetical protein
MQRAAGEGWCGLVGAAAGRRVATFSFGFSWDFVAAGVRGVVRGLGLRSSYDLSAGVYRD